MALRRVDLSTDVYFVCLNHAMCTEGEEIVGLLVGEVDEERVAHVVAVLILRRSDKRKDRVEISPEQLSNASTEAEKLACILKRPVRVVGWYHSHPKLTVYPSLVDVCTQESYQLMDEGFIGMIFSVFNTDPNKFGGRIQMICYQSQTVIIDCNVEKSHVEIPIQLVPSTNISDVCMNSVIQLPRFLCQEEQLAYQMANQVPLDYLTRLHNSSVYLRKMGQIAEVICGPLLKMLEERILNNEMKRKRLQERKKALTAMVEKARAEKAQKEKEMLEKAQKEQDMQEKVHKEQEKAQLEQEALLEEQELRAALLKDQEMRAKARQAQQEQEQSQMEDQEMQVKSQTEEQDVEDELKHKEQEVAEMADLGDQEVPQLKEQVGLVVEDQEMQELELEEQEWQAELDEHDWQAQIQRQEMQEVVQHQKQVTQGMIQFQRQDITLLKDQKVQENVDFKIQVGQEETPAKKRNYQENPPQGQKVQGTAQSKEQESSQIDIQTVQENIQPKQQEIKKKDHTKEQVLQMEHQFKIQNVQKPQLKVQVPPSVFAVGASSSQSQSVHVISPPESVSESIKSPKTVKVTDVTQKSNSSVDISNKGNSVIQPKVVSHDHKLDTDILDKSVKNDLSVKQSIDSCVPSTSGNVSFQQESPPKVQNTSFIESGSSKSKPISKKSPVHDPKH